MKNLLLIIITFFTLNAVAQEKKVTVKHDKTEAQAKVETKKLTQQLDLTSEQQKKVYTVLLNHYKEQLKTKQKTKQVIASKEKIKKTEIKKAIIKQKKGNSEKLNSQLKEILTKQQYKSYIESDKKQQKSKQKVLTRKN